MALKDRIRKAMGNVSPTEFARACKVSPAAVTFWLDGSTKSLRAEKAALIEAATGYRASWIVTGKGPERVGDTGGMGDGLDAAFSPEVRQKVLRLSDDDRLWAENVLRAHLRLPPKGAYSFTNNEQFASSAVAKPSYAGSTEAGAGALDEAEIPAPNTHEHQANRRPERRKGGGRG